MVYHGSTVLRPVSHAQKDNTNDTLTEHIATSALPVITSQEWARVRAWSAQQERSAHSRGRSLGAHARNAPLGCTTATQVDRHVIHAVLATINQMLDLEYASSAPREHTAPVAARRAPACAKNVLLGCTTAIQVDHHVIPAVPVTINRMLDLEDVLSARPEHTALSLAQRAPVFVRNAPLGRITVTQVDHHATRAVQVTINRILELKDASNVLQELSELAPEQGFSLVVRSVDLGRTTVEREDRHVILVPLILSSQILGLGPASIAFLVHVPELLERQRCLTANRAKSLVNVRYQCLFDSP